jgi:hypothetical protein
MFPDLQTFRPLSPYNEYPVVFMSNKLLLYKVILKPIWTQLWGSASTSNIEILERFQSKSLRMIADAPWYVPSVILRQDLQIPSVKEEIRRFSIQ